MSNTNLSVTKNQYTDLINTCLDADKVIFLSGKPGVGKSSILQQAAKSNNLLYVDIRLTGKDATDIGGLPNYVDHTLPNGTVIKRTVFTPTELFPLKGMGDRKRLLKWNEDGTPKLSGKTQDSYDGWLINLEEFTSAEESVQAACYQLLLDRMVGQYELEDDVYLVACGNGANDGAIASKLGTALKSRVITVEVAVDHKAWMGWAAKKGIHNYIVDYLTWKPELLHLFDPNTEDLSFPCPRKQIVSI